MHEKTKCKEAISAALWAAQIMPGMFSLNDLLGKVCRSFGTEFTAMCMTEMGLDKEAV